MLTSNEQFGVPTLTGRSNVTVDVDLDLEKKHLAESLAELCDLLESYAPVWYTREHHERAQSALSLSGGSGPRKPRPAKRVNGSGSHRSHL
jgi:hypothetical protein